MLAPTLEGCRAKLRRANVHIQEINRHLRSQDRAHYPRNAIRLSFDRKFKKINGVLIPTRADAVFVLRGTPPKLPMDLFSIPAGEAIHQLRTILDHLVYQMVIAKTKRQPTFRSAFPVIGKGRLHKGAWQTPAKYFAAQASCMRTHISRDAFRLIRNLQPYKRLRTRYADDLLWQLTELDNAYKHRLLAVIGYKIKEYTTSVKRGDDVIASRQFQPNILFEDGAEIARCALPDPTVPDSEMDAHGSVLFALAFPAVANRSNVGVFELIEEISNYVRDIIDTVAALPEFS